ncbi:Sterol O-acyltransferase 2 [Pseudocercospora fuligena]|uniref:O-acyltransferase n=1 Tax=Pseudocercospora fuligena TaxID=685502 RepID=A0A8H6RBQ7_9PEZI|nr:Sterol O-acyltransferase 2 [Pseudocercospora fuligena]
MTARHADASTSSRPAIPKQDTLDATQLKGTLGHNGVAELRPGSQKSNRNGTLNGSLAHDQQSVQGASDNFGHSESLPQSDDSAVSSDIDDAIENYDKLEVDPDTLIVNTRRSLDDGYRPSNSKMEGKEQNEEQEESAPEAKRKHKKRNSIQIRLERTDRKGKYILTADDPEIKAILRKGIEREAEEAEGKNKKPPRINFRDLVFTRRFTTFDRQNPASADSPFFGFFTLFWLCMFLIFFQVALRNWRDYGSWLGGNQVMRMMFTRDVLLLGITDGVMWISTFEGYFFQKLVRHGYISWARSGWVIQNIWQMAYLGSVIGWAHFREWPWTHTIFVVLHGLVFLMKQHSYAFYNGYLSGVYRRKRLLEQKLKDLENIEPLLSPPTSPTSPRESFIEVSSSVDLSPKTDDLKKRRPSTGPRTSTNFKKEHSLVANVAATIESGQHLTADQMSTMSDIVKHEISDLEKELRGKSDSNAKAYPNNLTLGNYIEYTCFPTLVYELDYPRQERTNWWYVLEKSVATFGVLCVMQVVSQGFIYPLVRRSLDMKENNMPLEDRWREFPFIVSDMLFPMLIEQLLTWYVIWECILNVLAEVTRFADRGFYGDWWNSVTWDQYARDWNRPVHNFLLRHVYHSSISTFHLSRTAATFVTFLLSALVHEMCMALIFSKVRGYLFWMQLLQMPLVAFSRSKFMKGRTVLGNVMFWTGLFIGPALLTSLYLVI